MCVFSPNECHSHDDFHMMIFTWYFVLSHLVLEWFAFSKTPHTNVEIVEGVCGLWKYEIRYVW